MTSGYRKSKSHGRNTNRSGKPYAPETSLKRAGTRRAERPSRPARSRLFPSDIALSRSQEAVTHRRIVEHELYKHIDTALNSTGKDDYTKERHERIFTQLMTLSNADFATRASREDLVNNAEYRVGHTPTGGMGINLSVKSGDHTTIYWSSFYNPDGSLNNSGGVASDVTFPQGDGLSFDAQGGCRHRFKSASIPQLQSDLTSPSTVKVIAKKDEGSSDGM